jgi:single-stranded-DNA-specific exonuclease
MKKWDLEKVEEKLIKNIEDNLGVSHILALLLVNRGVKTLEEAEKFLHLTLYDVYEPYLLKDMDKAVGRIKKAINNKEKIYIHGDYDVDGVTSMAILYKFFKIYDLEVYYHIPHRIEEGYGISKKAISEAKEKKINLFIAVDCGITSYSLTKELLGSGIDVIIIDHHRPKKGINLPQAYAIIDPWQKKCSYPNKDITSSGLVFKLIHALLGINNEFIWNILDLVSLGLIADVSPLVGENRILVKYGLEKLKATSNLGLRALINIAGLNKEQIRARAVSYIIAPRLNAMGRISSACDSFKILITESEEEAEKLASVLDEHNRERQQIESKILLEAVESLESKCNFKEEKILVLSGNSWHRGVVGIVASKIVDRYNRPAIVLDEEDGVLQGSGRSIKNFHIFDALSNCDEILEEYGGHAYACGLVLKKENFFSFKEKINSYADSILKGEDLIPKVRIDAMLELKEIDENLIREISLLSPFGSGNPEPVFLTQDLTILTQPQSLPRKGTKFWVKKGNLSYEAVGFGIDINPEIFKIGSNINLVYVPRINEWEGIKSVNLYIKDFKLG